MAENPLNEITESIKKQNEATQEQSSKSVAVVEKIGSDVKNTATKSIKGIGETAKKTVTNLPNLAMAGLDPSTQLIFGQIGSAVKSSFDYIKSFGSVISDKDSDAAEERDETQEKIQESTEQNTESLTTLNESVSDGFGRLLAFMQGQSLEEYETQREEAIERKRLLSEIGKLGDAGAGVGEEDESGFLTPIFANIAAMVGPLLMKILTPLAVGIGVIVGVVAGYAKELKLIGQAIAGVAKLFARVFSVRGMAGTFTGIIDTFRSVVERIRTAFTSLSTFVGNLLKPITEAVKRVQTTAGFFSNILGGLGRLGAIVGKVAGVVSKVFVPLRFIMVGFETLKGTIEGFKEGGILGAIQGAVSGFFKALVGVPLDLIKSMISFILDKFGFENAAEALENFSFSDIIVDIVKAPFKLFEDLRDWISEKVSGLVSKFASFIPRPIKTLLGIGGDGDDESDEDSGEGALDKTAEVLASINPFSKDKLEEAASNLKDVGKSVSGFFGGLFGNDDGEESKIGSAVSDTVGSIGSTISGFFGGGNDEEESETAASGVAEGRRAARDRLRGDSQNADVGTQESSRSTAMAFENLQGERDQIEMEESRRDREGRGGDVYAPTNVNSSSTTQVIKPLPAVSRTPSSAYDLFYNVNP